MRRLELSPRSIFGGLSALARGYIRGVTSFSNPGRASRHFFTVSPSDSLTVELVCQGAARGFAMEVGTSNVKKVNEEPRGIWSAVDYLTGTFIACREEVIFGPAPLPAFYSATDGVVALWPRGHGLKYPNTRFCGG